ncbi:MAG: serine/threonine-protein phosphatase [Betaproteobacteria bacterium]|nr:serine/threonine-protein phosphatase [Betaproteobacteria bacterium]
MMDPAHDIGGDLYDSFFVGPDRLVAVIGDVSGKGIPAALFMARVIAQLRLVAISETSPAAVLSRLNGLLCEHNDAGMFVTLLVLVLDVRDGTFVYSNAGHNPPVVMRQHETGFLPMPKGLVA